MSTKYSKSLVMAFSVLMVTGFAAANPALEILNGDLELRTNNITTDDGGTVLWNSAGDEIGQNLVTSSSINSGAVTSSEIASTSVGSGEITSGAVGDSELDNSATLNINTLHLSNELNDANVSDSVTAGSVDGFVSASTPLEAGNFSDNSVTDAKVSDSITIDGGFVSVDSNERLDSGNISSSVAGSGLSGGAGSSLSVNTGTAVNITSDSVAVDLNAIAGTNLDASNNQLDVQSTGNNITIQENGGNLANSIDVLNFKDSDFTLSETSGRVDVDVGSGSVNSGEIANGAIGSNQIGTGDVVNSSHLNLGSGLVEGTGGAVDVSSSLTIDGGKVKNSLIDVGTSPTINAGNLTLGNALGDSGSDGSLDVKTGTAINITQDSVAVDLNSIADGNLSASGDTLDVKHNFVLRSGDSMSGNLDMGGTANNNVTNAGYVDMPDTGVASPTDGDGCNTEGAITYNGSHHLGCGDAGGTLQWNVMY